MALSSEESYEKRHLSGNYRLTNCWLCYLPLIHILCNFQLQIQFPVLSSQQIAFKLLAYYGMFLFHPKLFNFFLAQYRRIITFALRLPELPELLQSFSA